MFLPKIQNSVQNLYTVTHGSCDILKYHYEIFVFVKFTCLSTHFIHCINTIEFTVLYDSVSHDESNA